jgi:hypothetical protein
MYEPVRSVLPHGVGGLSDNTGEDLTVFGKTVEFLIPFVEPPRTLGRKKRAKAA